MNGEESYPEILDRVLGTAEVWAEPPPDLDDQIVAAIRDASRETATPPPARANRARVWLVRVTAAAALVLVVALAAVVATNEQSEGEEFALAATELIPGASGEATVENTGSGLSISLNVEDLPPADDGFFYQAWMKGPDGSVPIGTFHAREGDGPIELWSGVDVENYPMMTVTIQEEGAGPESSGQVVLTGEIPPVS